MLLKPNQTPRPHRIFDSGVCPSNYLEARPMCEKFQGCISLQNTIEAGDVSLRRSYFASRKTSNFLFCVTCEIDLGLISP